MLRASMRWPSLQHAVPDLGSSRGICTPYKVSCRQRSVALKARSGLAFARIAFRPENDMTQVKPIAPTRISGTEFTYAQGMRAGNWLFFTGHEATDFQTGIVPQ